MTLSKSGAEFLIDFATSTVSLFSAAGHELLVY